MHVIDVKKSRKRSSFMINSYFKDSIFTTGPKGWKVLNYVYERGNISNFVDERFTKDEGYFFC